jgi:hypothetical protein
MGALTFNSYLSKIDPSLPTECPVCYDEFELKAPRNADGSLVTKAPVFTTARTECAMHAVCLECFSRISSCPFCSVRIEDKKVMLNTAVTQRWEAHSKSFAMVIAASQSNGQAASSSSSTPIKPREVVAPEKWGTLQTLLNSESTQKEIDNLRTMVIDAAQKVSKVMHWDSAEVSTAFIEEFQVNMYQWMCAVDGERLVGFTLIQPSSTSYGYNVHWTGVTDSENRDASYKQFFHDIVDYLRKSTSSNNLCIAINHFHPRETDLFKLIQELAVSMGWRYALGWGNNRKSTIHIYPNDKLWVSNKPANLSSVRIFNPHERALELEHNIQKEKERVLKESNLAACFRLASASIKGTEAAASAEANELVNRFKLNSNNFFVYTINNKAIGYVLTVNYQNHMQIISSFLMSTSREYEGHFMQKFVEWVGNSRIRAGYEFVLSHTSKQIEQSKMRDALIKYAPDMGYSINHDFDNVNVTVVITKKNNES